MLMAQGKHFGIKDGDNHIEILATNHQADDSAGKIYSVISPKTRMHLNSGIHAIQKQELK